MARLGDGEGRKEFGERREFLCKKRGVGYFGKGGGSCIYIIARIYTTIRHIQDPASATPIFTLYSSQSLLQICLFFSDPQTCPSHVDDPDHHGHDREEAADDKIHPPQIRDDIGRRSLKVEDAGAEDGLVGFDFSLLSTPHLLKGEGGWGNKTYSYKGAGEKD